MIPLSRVLTTADLYGDPNKTFKRQKLSMRQSDGTSELILESGTVATYLYQLRSNRNFARVCIDRRTMNVPSLSITYLPPIAGADRFIEQEDETMLLQEEVVVPDEIEVVVIDEEEVVEVPDEIVEEVVEEEDNVVEVRDVDEDEDEDEDEEEEDVFEEDSREGIWGSDDYFHEDGPPEGHIPYYGPWLGADL